ncbi:MAG: 16S rRNA (guanine(966)-N(2))-methyltransferase RsmD [Clostridia bacterium]|nr:16S rRNA (guanine(966)-N(2))-methyltransferase RsmD [Clostridia bacterium]
MRIITGSARGTHLETPDGETTRPTTDRVKEAVFSMIQFELEGRKVLDLFAGSGQMALEALSRGAEKATMIDSSRQAVDVMIANAKKTRLFDRCRISSVDSLSFLSSGTGKEKYDLVFLDPPYGDHRIPSALEALVRGGWIVRGGLVVCESDAPEALREKGKKNPKADRANIGDEEDLFGENESLRARFDIRKDVRYGRVRITLLTYKGEDET